MNQTNASPNMMQLVAVTERGEGDAKKSFWTRIGVAFENRDGSWNLRFEYLPAHMSETTIQLRPFRPREEDDAEQEQEPSPRPTEDRRSRPRRDA